jgi:hypothetical protein
MRVARPLKLPHRLQESRARPAQAVPIGLQAGEDRHVALLDDTPAMPLDVSAAGFIAALAVALSHRDGGHRHEHRRQNEIPDH